MKTTATDRRWIDWSATVATLAGIPNLDGNYNADGYCLDFAVGAFNDGWSASDYAAGIRFNLSTKKRAPKMTTRTRYFAATDGTVTVWRGTGRPDGYRFASFVSWVESGHGVGQIAFSNTPKTGYRCAVEITKAQHAMLNAAKDARLGPDAPSYRKASPQECWVRNDAVQAPTERQIKAHIAAMASKDAAEGIE